MKLLIPLLIPAVLFCQSFTVKTFHDMASSSMETFEPAPMFGMPDTAILGANSVWVGRYDLWAEVYGKTFVIENISPCLVAYNYSSAGFVTDFTYPNGSTMNARYNWVYHRGGLDTTITYYQYPPGEYRNAHIIISDTVRLGNYDTSRFVTSTGTGPARNFMRTHNKYNQLQDTAKVHIIIDFRLAIGSTPGHLHLRWCSPSFSDMGVSYCGGTFGWFVRLKRGSSLWMKRVL